MHNGPMAGVQFGLSPAKLGRRIVGMHLCDNVGHQIVFLVPGDGAIDWPQMLFALGTDGCAGS